MKLFVCFGGAAAVADDGGEAAGAARHRGRRGRSPSSFRGRFLPGKKGGKRKPSAAAASSPLAEAKKRGVDVDGIYGVFAASTASSVASSALLSSAASLQDSDCSSSSSCRSLASSSAFSGALPPPAVKRRPRASTSPAAGAAAVVLCLLMVVLCGRVGATLLMSTALYLFPRRWPATICTTEDDAESPECESVSASKAEEDTAKRKVVMEGFLVRNRKK